MVQKERPPTKGEADASLFTDKRVGKWVPDVGDMELVVVEGGIPKDGEGE